MKELTSIIYRGNGYSCFVLLRYTSMMKISKSSLSCATQKRFCFGNTWIDLVCWYMYTSDIYFLYSLSWNLMIFFLHINLTGNIKKIYFLSTIISYGKNIFFLKQEYKCQKDYRKEAHEPTCIIQNEKSTYIYKHTYNEDDYNWYTFVK